MTDTIKNLNDYYSELATTGLRLQHQFQVIFSPTADADWPTSLANVSFYAEGVNIPGRTQNKQDISYLGFPFKLPTTTVFDENITLTMRCDAGETGSLLRNQLLKWMNVASNIALANGLSDSASTGGGVKRIPANSKIRLMLLSSDLQEVTETYELFGAFPTSIGQMNMSNATADVATFETVFVYQYFTINPG